MNPSASSSNHRLENNRPPRLPNYRFRPQTYSESRRKRSRVDESESPPILRELENLAANVSDTAAIAAIDNGGEKSAEQVAVVQQSLQQPPKSSQESENDYDIDFSLDEDEEKQLAEIFESYSVGTKRSQLTPTVEEELEVEVEYEPELGGVLSGANRLDIEQLAVRQDGGGFDESFGGTHFDALFIPDRIKEAAAAPFASRDVQCALDDKQGLQQAAAGDPEASGCFVPQAEDPNADPDIVITNKSIPIETDAKGLLDPNKALQTESKKDPEVLVQETKSPLQLYRARGKMREPRLSVTDLVMNLWCEQQFHYTLLRGFKRQTPAMRAGTAIHKEAEEEVHTVVPVEVRIPEDTWGLRIYNMLQSIEALKNGGVTRELEVWGWIDDVWTIGVIDEVRFEKDAYDAYSQKVRRRRRKSKTSDDEDVAASVSGSEESEGSTGSGTEKPKRKRKSKKPKEEESNVASGSEGSENNIEGSSEKPRRRGRGRPKNSESISKSESGSESSSTSESKEVPIPATPQKKKDRQTTLDTYFSPTQSAASPTQKGPEPQPVFVIDLKTRASDKPPPVSSSQGQMTFLQLMLYHRLLSDILVSHPKKTTDYLCAFQKLDPHAHFSDSFIAQIANLDVSDSSILTLDTLLEYNSIEKLYGLFHKHLRKTVSAVQPNLTAVYRWQANGEIIGATSFEFDDETLRGHVDNVMSWWKGQRETIGVGINESWKCHRCEFYDECGWRIKKIEEAGEARRKRKEELRKIEEANPEFQKLKEGNLKKWNTRAGMSDIVFLSKGDKSKRAEIWKVRETDDDDK